MDLFRFFRNRRGTLNLVPADFLFANEFLPAAVSVLHKPAALATTWLQQVLNIRSLFFSLFQLPLVVFPLHFVNSSFVSFDKFRSAHRQAASDCG